MTVDGLFITTDGEIAPITYQADDCLAFLQEMIGGWVEAVPTNGEFSMYCHEEGKIEGLPLNPRATEIVRPWLRPGDYIAGDVILCGPPNAEGYDTSLDPHNTSFDAEIRKALVSALG